VKSRKPRNIPAFLANLGLALAALALLLAPRLLEGQAALQRARYHAERAGGRRSAEHAREAARAAVEGLDRLAPLSLGTEGVRVALDLGKRLQARDRAAALALVREVRVGIERVRASRLRGFGLGPLADEARGLEEGLTAPAAEARP